MGTDVGTGVFGAGSQTSASSDGGFGSGFGGGFGSPDSSFGGGFGNNDSSGFGGGFGGGFCCNNSFDDNAGFGAPETKVPAEEVSSEDFMPDNPDKEVSYDPEPLYTMANARSNPSLSEAEAVANFISVKYGTETNVLNLCFDVGGSTTDISALFYLKNGVTMIKQNSLRFAAQRVSQSVAKFPQFKRVLSSICAEYKIQMVGLNFGNDTYNEHTAPYFFDQIVNRLNDNQLENLYQRIAADCQQLICFNM